MKQTQTNCRRAHRCDWTGADDAWTTPHCHSKRTSTANRIATTSVFGRKSRRIFLCFCNLETSKQASKPEIEPEIFRSWKHPPTLCLSVSRVTVEFGVSLYSGLLPPTKRRFRCFGIIRITFRRWVVSILDFHRCWESDHCCGFRTDRSGHSAATIPGSLWFSASSSLQSNPFNFRGYFTQRSAAIIVLVVWLFLSPYGPSFLLPWNKFCFFFLSKEQQTISCASQSYIRSVGLNRK